MARKPAQAPQPRKAELTADQIKSGITKIDRRLRELEQLAQSSQVQMLEHEADALWKKIDQTLSDIFGIDTEEYRRYRVHPLYSSGVINLGRSYKVPDYEHVQRYHEGIASAIARLKTVTFMLKERLEDMGDSPEGKARRAIESLDLHREIERAVGQLYRNGHYANAIEDAVKALNAFVKLRSGVEQDGVSLMQHVFSVKNPVLKFNDLADESDRNEQQGFMQLFTGAVTGLRNPRAHKIIQDDPEEAIEFIAFISLLAKLVDKAKKA
jgi:uncharacterized protein (TIGR02391 family)